MLERREPSGGGTIGASRGAVMTKSVSSPFTLPSPLVWNQTPRPPRRPPFSPPIPILGPR